MAQAMDSSLATPITSATLPLSGFFMVMVTSGASGERLIVGAEPGVLPVGGHRRPGRRLVSGRSEAAPVPCAGRVHPPFGRS